MTNKELKEFDKNEALIKQLDSLKDDISEKDFKNITDFKEIVLKDMSPFYKKAVDFNDGKGKKQVFHVKYNGYEIKFPVSCMRQLSEVLKNTNDLRAIRIESFGDGMDKRYVLYGVK